MDNRKTLFAGPFVGELGWELFCWQGFIRKIAYDGKYERVIVACRPGHELLYQDFVTDIVHYNPASNETDMWYNRSCDSARMRNFHRSYTVGITNLTVIPYDEFRTRWWLQEPFGANQHLVSLRQSNMRNPTKPELVLFIVRATDKYNTAFRNWPVAHAQQLAEYLQEHRYTVGCVGLPYSAAGLVGVEDYRGWPLQSLALLMAGAKVIVGPQCGPIHFASLCGLPQVTWQTCKEHAERVRKCWNPFGSRVETIPSDDSHWKKRSAWTPPLDWIVSSLSHILEERYL